MIIVQAATTTDPTSPLWPALFLAVGAATAAATGIFRRRSIVGPDRIEPADPMDPLAVAMGGGLMVYFYGSLLLMHHFLAAHPAAGPTTFPATSPATQPASNALTNADVLIDLLSRTVAILTIVALLMIWYPRPRRLGLSPARLPMGVLTGLGSLLMVMPLMMLALLATELALRPNGQYVHPYLQLLGAMQNRNQRILILFSILVAAPISEELFFRGCVQTFIVGAISRRKPWPPARTRWIAVILTSLLFAAAHSDWWSRPPIFVLSLCLGYAYERTGNLWTAITIHAMFNATQTLIFLG